MLGFVEKFFPVPGPLVSSRTFWPGLNPSTKRPTDHKTPDSSPYMATPCRCPDSPQAAAPASVAPRAHKLLAGYGHSPPTGLSVPVCSVSKGGVEEKNPQLYFYTPFLRHTKQSLKPLGWVLFC